MKLSNCILMVAFAATSALAQTPPPAAAPPQNTTKFDFTPFIQEADTNKDGKISLAEWKATGVCESIFSMLHTAKDGDMTVAELTARMPQAEADQNKDGKLNTKEMIWVCNAGPSGAPPPGGAQGNAPAGSTPAR
ncbi:MAG: hypothetical protein QM808_04115 [Steroidobacteraceae bacterium]